jgi:prepilin-type N-terminal cleavage/methylation domain-containing protein
MKRPVFFSLLKNSRGMSLVEVLVALSVGAFICAAATAILAQILMLPSRTGNDILAMRQVQNAGYSISMDGVQSQNITATAPSGFPLSISFVNWPVGSVNNNKPVKTTIVYSIIGGNSLQRQITVADERYPGTVISQGQRIVADHITTISAQYAAGVLTITITAQIDSAAETRMYQISPRSG